MVLEIKGDITAINKGIILHQVNCQNAMGSGVAKAISSKYPIVKQKYHELFKTNSGEKLFGKLQGVVINENLIIMNSFSQFSYGNAYKNGICFTDMGKLVFNIKKALLYAEKNNTKLYIPKRIGCGLAGGNWDELYSQLKDLSDNLIIVELT